MKQMTNFICTFDQLTKYKPGFIPPRRKCSCYC